VVNIGYEDYGDSRSNTIFKALIPGMEKQRHSYGCGSSGYVVGILVFMIIPLPTMLLDILLSLNITLSLIVLLVAMYIMNPLELSAFPSMLLLATLL